MPKPDPQPDIVSGTTRDRVTGMDIRIDRMGEGRTIVVLNGLMGLNQHWFPSLAHIAGRAECVLIQPPLLEMRGKGCTVEGVAHLVISVLDTILEGPAVLMGNSLGGHIALHVLRLRPDLAEALVLIGSSGLLERGFERNISHSAQRDWLEVKIRELFYDQSKILPGMIEMAHEELQRRSSARAFVKLGRSAKNDHMGPYLGGIACPTQIIWGDKDIVTPPEVAQEFAREIPDTRLTWVKDCGHAPHIERPDEVVEALGAFLDELDRADAKPSSPAGQSGVA